VNPFLFVTDLDNTFVGDDAALARLQQVLSEHRQTYGTKIVYSTGRSPTLYKQLKAEKQLLDPDALVTSVGTEIYTDGKETPDQDWAAILSQGWDREAIGAASAHFGDLVPQPDTEQRPFKVSYFLTEEAAIEVLPGFESALQERNLSVKLIYSAGKDLDVLPDNGNKGLAMQFLAKRLGFSPDRTVACGDSGNDIALFSVGDERGIIVGNAKPELRQWYEENASDGLYLARAVCAGGILEGLEHFKFV
jgi:sucrose-6F-phosphate phosphohydrolase